LFFRASGQSMWPFIRDGHRLIVRPATGREIKPGDIIVYRFCGALVCHRVVKKRVLSGEVYFLARGDGTAGAPEKVYPAMVVGLVCGIVRGRRSVRWQGPVSGMFNGVILAAAPLICRFSGIISRLLRKK